MAYYYYNNSSNDYGGGRRRFLGNTPTVTRTLIIINIIVFAFTLLNKNFMYGAFALYYPSSPNFHWWQYITHMFMHGGWWHIFFNMYSLYLFGSIVERMMGPKKFLWFYLLCGFGAAAMHLGAEYLEVASGKAALSSVISVPTVGASGAIYGLLIAYALMFPQQRLTLIFPPITLKARTWVLMFAAIELFTGVRGVADGVAHFAHLGGMLIGWLLISYWRKKGTLFNGYGY